MKNLVLFMLVGAIAIGYNNPADAAPGHRDHRDHHTSHNNHNRHSYKVLPKAHHKIVHRGAPYFYTGGRFYHHKNGVYVSIVAPLGAIVPALPNGYVSIGVGSNRYFHFGDVYYRHAPTGYVVVEKPVGVSTESAEKKVSAGSDKLIIYPAAGQNDKQKSRDKYECHEWASSETRYDPINSDSDDALKADYQRAMSACLEARNYVVK
jgi:hypothetical protein